MKHYLDICKLVGDGKDVSAEVVATDFKGMIAKGRKFAELHENIVVKVPMTPDGVKAIVAFSEMEIRTNCTLVFSVGQAILAAKAGTLPNEKQKK